VASIVALVLSGLNLGIDFEGGTQWQFTVAEGSASASDVRDALEAGEVADAKVLILGDDGVRVQAEALKDADANTVTAALASYAGVESSEVSVTDVGPTWGDQVSRKAITALVFFFVLIGLYLSFRFEWKMAFAALTAVVHDIVITVGVYAILGFEVTPPTVVALLTILGFSLYDTVVVFDKVTENVHELHAKSTYTDIVNLSMNQVLMRSINTSLTSLLPVGSLLFVGSLVLGADTLQEFALALFIGMAVGTYSSIYVASPLLALWKERETEWERARVRAARRRGDAGAAVADQVTATVTPATPGVAAKPPKQRRKRR
jgi:preprotein translocase subunit SecF